jgi:hypothetical protein
MKKKARIIPIFPELESMSDLDSLREIFENAGEMSDLFKGKSKEQPSGKKGLKVTGEIDATDFDVEEVREAVEELPYDGYEPW